VKGSDVTPSSVPNWRRPTFYRVELFRTGELAGIEFFDPHELALAKERVLAAAASGDADRAEVRDDAGALVFVHPPAAA